MTTPTHDAEGRSLEHVERLCRLRPHGRPCRNEVTVDGRGSDLVCAWCLGGVRDHLKSIMTMSAALLGEALVRGLNSEAAHLTGPAADPETWDHRRLSALAARIDPHWLDDQVDLHHPAWVLGTWERHARDHLAQRVSPGTSRPTLTEAKTYLDGHLTRLAHAADFDFSQLADDVRLCHDHVERVLHLDEHHEVGVDCPSCGQARLRKDYGTTEDGDRWTCPRCHQWWTEHDYRAKVSGTYIAVSPVLTASQISAQYRVPEGSVRGWATRGDVRKRGRDESGRQLYLVEDVLACRDRKRAG